MFAELGSWIFSVFLAALTKVHQRQLKRIYCYVHRGTLPIPHGSLGRICLQRSTGCFKSSWTRPRFLQSKLGVSLPRRKRNERK
jgi:hypothetical protein